MRREVSGFGGGNVIFSPAPTWARRNRITTSGVCERPTKLLTGCRNIGWPLAARNSSYYSTNIVGRPESLHIEWGRTHPDGSCSFDWGGRHTVRRSKRRRVVGRRSADIAWRLRQARRVLPIEVQPSTPVLSCHDAPLCEGA